MKFIGSRDIGFQILQMIIFGVLLSQMMEDLF